MDTKFDYELFKVFQESERTKEADWNDLKERIQQTTTHLEMSNNNQEKLDRDGTKQ